MAQQTDSTQYLEGKLQRTDLESFKWFKDNYNQYKPSLSVVEELVKFEKCSLLVVLGTWCSDSHELIPQLFKVADLVGWEKIELIGVDRKKHCSSIDIKSLNIEYVPFILVFKDKKLMGKIIETAEKTIEEDLLKILETH
jgi:ribosomal protein L30/L7E